MEKMAAIRQRRELLEQTQRAFSLRCKNYLSSKFVFHVNTLYFTMKFNILYSYF
jgi:hypothetical protein